MHGQFEKGNTLGAKPARFGEALRRVLAQSNNGESLRQIAEKLVELAIEGEPWAVKELADRIDGKAAQDINIGGQLDNPLLVMESSESLGAHIRSIAAARAVIERVGKNRKEVAEE